MVLTYFSAIIWIMFIVHFGDLNGAILLNYVTWVSLASALRSPD
jgi:tryptophan-rich sensory protein